MIRAGVHQLTSISVLCSASDGKAPSLHLPRAGSCNLRPSENQIILDHYLCCWQLINRCCFSLQLYRRLSEVLGLNDETMVLSVFIGKM